MRIPRVKPQVDYVRMQGGLDQSSPALTVTPGSLLAAQNYEANVDGGYRRIDGYERYDGQASPSDASYTLITATGTVAVNDTVTGVTSSATGVVSRVHTTGFDLTKVTGTFVAENYTVGGVATGAITNSEIEGAEDPEEHSTSLNAAADIYRADIAAPTGSGAVRGIAILAGTVYCFRDNAAGTAGLIYKATSSGWEAVTLHYEISFDTGTGLVAEGDTITQVTSGATATVERVVLESGAWGTDAAGRLIISSITDTFDATNALQVSGTECTATSLATQITLLPGGRYETVANNFYASADTRRIYGCDGVNRGFEFDGSVYVPIDTGMPSDVPNYVNVYQQQLFFGFKGSIQNSEPGNPYSWTAITGSLEVGLGDEISGMSNLGGSALGAFARNSSHQLLGKNVEDFTSAPISDEVGCIPRTLQRIGRTYFLDDRGVVGVYPTDKYGNFELATISRRVQTAIDEIRQVAIASTTYKARDQYRIYGSDGTGLCMTILPESVAFTSFRYPDNVACAVSGEDADGKDVVFLGSDQGMVYQADKGSSFDGDSIVSYLIFPFNHSNSPTMLKSYLSVTLELTSEIYSNFLFSIDFSYGDINVAAHRSETIQVEGGSGFWDISGWDEFSYDSSFVASPTLQVAGTGTNMNLTLYSDSEIDMGHRVDGVLVKYISRRLVQ